MQSCRDALASDSEDTLHLLERTNIDLQVQNSIVPKAVNIAKFRVSGKLPSLHINISDTKYKALMRLMNVCIPKFDDEEIQPASAAPVVGASGFKLSPLFAQAGAEYHIVDDGDDQESPGRGVKFYDTEDGNADVCSLLWQRFAPS